MKKLKRKFYGAKSLSLTSAHPLNSIMFRQLYRQFRPGETPRVQINRNLSNMWENLEILKIFGNFNQLLRVTISVGIDFPLKWPFLE